MITKIIVGTSIFFSAILNVNSRIKQILINTKSIFDFYAPKYVRTALFKHKQKIRKITNLTNEECIELYKLTIKNITSLNHSILPKKDFKVAYEYCQNIDVDDTIFVGFSEYLKAKLWTADKELT